jgi:phenylalanine-4-hydroxylase
MSAAANHLHKCTDATVTPLKTTIHFSITDKVGALDDCLAAIKSMSISLTRIES